MGRVVVLHMNVMLFMVAIQVRIFDAIPGIPKIISVTRRQGSRAQTCCASIATIKPPLAVVAQRLQFLFMPVHQIAAYVRTSTIVVSALLAFILLLCLQAVDLTV